MNTLDSAIVTAVVFAPMLGALLLAFMPSGEGTQLKATTLVTMLATFALSVVMYLEFHVGQPGYQLEYRHAWVESLGISYHVGVDGVAVTLMLLTGFLGPVVTLAGWNGGGQRVKEFCLALLVLQSAMLGAFAALDLVVFYTFWELMLLPMYLLIGVFGSENRVAAATKFFLFTMAGSMLMLIAILYLYYLSGQHGPRTFDVPVLMSMPAPPPMVQRWLFVGFALAFAVKVPMFPVHTWLPDAHTEAPAAGSMVLAGVLLKLGTFGFMRYAMPLFPEAARWAAPTLGVLSVIGIVYGSLMCLAQRDMKRLIAYSSVAHLGFVMLGLSALGSPQASSGAVLQMVNHGISTGALFLLVGVLYERRHTRLIAEYGGLAKVTPILAACFIAVTLTSIGLPGTNGFVGEFLILSGTFLSGLKGAAIYSAVAATGVILGAAYMLTMVQRVWLGPMRNPRNEGIQDLSAREAFAVVPLILVAIGMGIYPQPFLDRISPAALSFTERLRPGAAPLQAQQGEGATAPQLGARPMPGTRTTPGMRSPPGNVVVDPSRLNQLRPVGK